MGFWVFSIPLPTRNFVVYGGFLGLGAAVAAQRRGLGAREGQRLQRPTGVGQRAKRWWTFAWLLGTLATRIDGRLHLPTMLPLLLSFPVLLSGVIIRGTSSAILDGRPCVGLRRFVATSVARTRLARGDVARKQKELMPIAVSPQETTSDGKDDDESRGGCTRRDGTRRRVTVAGDTRSGE